MTGEQALDPIRDWVRAAAQGAAAKGGSDTIVLEVAAVLAITDAFVITHGTNRRQVLTIAGGGRGAGEGGRRTGPATRRGHR